MPDCALPAAARISRTMFSKAEIERVRAAFVDNASKLMSAALKGEENKKYIGGQFISNVADKDYEYVRQAYLTVGAENLAKFIDE